MVDAYLAVSKKIENWPKWVLYTEAIFMGATLAVNFLVFFFTLCLLSKYHNYEYKARKASLVSFFICLTLYYLVKTFIVIVLNSCYVVYGSSSPDMSTICRMFQPGDWHYELVSFLHVLNIPQILLAFSCIHLKRLSDPLQGVSKLDNLVLVSVFQRPTIFKDSSQERKVENKSDESEDGENEILITDKLIKNNLKSRQNSITHDKLLP